MISVIIPTFKRLELLKRAVASVLVQTYADWELIISDDEEPAGATWDYLCHLENTDARIRVFRNTSAHGQAGNVNNALACAGGEWIKPLFDDDCLRPQCLEVFVKAVSRFPKVVLAGCLAYRYRNGKLHHVDRSPTISPIEIVEQHHVHLAMYLQDYECGTMPTQMFIKRSAVLAGGIMHDDGCFVSAIDQIWFAEILRHGDRMHLAVPLVEEYQGMCETVTSGSPRAKLDNDNLLLREYLHPLIPSWVEAPSVEVTKQMILGIRGLHRVYSGHFVEGLSLVNKVRSSAAVKLIMYWLLRKLFPGRFSVTPRIRSSL